MGDALSVVTKPNTLQSTLPMSAVAAGLSNTFDRPDRVLLLGQTPGSKRYVGTMDGDKFKFKKKSDALNFCARELHGKLVDMPDGNTLIEYRFEPGSTQRLVFITLIAMLLAFSFLVNMLYASTVFVDFMRDGGLGSLFFVVASVVAVSVLLWRFTEMAGQHCDEELLDCVKRIASGSAPLSD